MANYSNFFLDLFTSTDPTNFDLYLKNIEPCVTNKMNQLLKAKFIEVEVKETLFKMNPLGAPGLDVLLLVSTKKIGTH